jgi:hypothetical protein
MDTLSPLPAQAREEFFRSLGHAVATAWSHLPQDAQHLLFEQAVAFHGEAGRQQLAVFLHNSHARTSDSMKARAMPEPDSLGG